MKSFLRPTTLNIRKLNQKIHYLPPRTFTRILSHFSLSDSFQFQSKGFSGANQGPYSYLKFPPPIAFLSPPGNFFVCHIYVLVWSAFLNRKENCNVIDTIKLVHTIGSKYNSSEQLQDIKKYYFKLICAGNGTYEKQ